MTKHAAQMTCISRSLSLLYSGCTNCALSGFIESATADSRIIAHIQQKPSTAEPSTQSNLPELIPSLLSGIDKEGGSHQDRFQAQASLGWIHWTLNEPGLASGRLPKDFAATISTLSSDGQELSPWTEACLVKGCYIKGKWLLYGESEYLTAN